MTSAITAFDFGSAVLNDRTQIQIPSQIEWIPATLDFIRQRLLQVGSCDEVEADRLLMGLHEGLTNAVIHGNLEIPSALKEDGDAFARHLVERLDDPAYNRRCVRVGLGFDGTGWQWIITDEGPGFNVEAVLHRLEVDPENGFLASGRGILMMRAFFDDVRWEAGGRRLILTWAPRAEKRVAPRWSILKKVQVSPIRTDGSVDWSVAQEAITRNLSSGGTLLLQQTLGRAMNQAVRVMLTLDVDGQPLHLPAQVCHWTPHDDGFVEIGCSFQMENPVFEADAQKRVQDAVEGLIERAQRSRQAMEERRQAPRLPFNERIELLPAGTHPGVTGFTQDLSRGGVKFITTQEVPAEDRTLLFAGEGKPPLRIRARILRCVRLTDTFYDVAASFVDTE